MFEPPLLDMGRVERVANAVVESIKQSKLSIEKCSTQLDAAMLRQQTLGIIGPSSLSLIQADMATSERRSHTCLIYKYEDSQGCSVPTIIVSEEKQQVHTAVVRTRYNGNMSKAEMVSIIEGPSCASDFRALEGLYKLSRAAVKRASMMSGNPNGFDDWDDLDLP
jgi:hypothetical protein